MRRTISRSVTSRCDYSIISTILVGRLMSVLLYIYKYKYEYKYKYIYIYIYVLMF